MPSPLLSVVIPTYNRKELLLRCLEALAIQTFDRSEYEVIVVDDGSTDGTAAMLERARYPFQLSSVRIEHSGPSTARNAGAAIASGNYLAFTEDDVTASPDWLAAAAQSLSLKNVAILEGRTLDETTGRSVRRFERDRVLSFIPCNLILERKAFQAVGGYDPAFFDAKTQLYFREDADLGFRLLEAGFSAAVDDQLVVLHPAQFATLRSCLRHVRRYVFDPLLYRKHPFRFRMMIEVKNLFGFRVHRPQHYVAIVYAFLLCWILWQIVFVRPIDIVPQSVMAFLCSAAFRFKYQGWRSLRLYRIHDMLGFLLVPLVYLGSLGRGCLRFRTLGPLV